MKGVVCWAKFLASYGAAVELAYLSMRLSPGLIFFSVECGMFFSALDLNRSGVQILTIFLRETQDLGYGISDEILLLQSEASIGVFDHGGKVGASVGTLVGENQVLGLCKVYSRTQSLHQSVQVLRVVVVFGVVQERTVLVTEVFFMLVVYEHEKRKL